MTATSYPTRTMPALFRETLAEHVLPLAFDATAPATARRAARTILSDWRLSEDTVYDVLLVISELVTNALEHASPPVCLHLRLTASGRRPDVRIMVTDAGRATSPGRWVASCTDDEHGRGQAVVAALVTDSGLDGNNRWVAIEPA